MSSQAFNFSGTGAQSGNPLTVNAGEVVRLRLSASTGYPALSLSITQNGITDVVPIQARAGDAIDLPACVAGDVIFVVYEGQTAADTAIGILESIPSTVSISGGVPAGAALDGTDATGIAAPPGGVGIRGWLSGIYKAVAGILQVQLAMAAPAVLTRGNAYNFAAYAIVRLQVDAIAGGDIMTFTKSLASGGTAYAVVASDETGQAWPNGITAPGLYSMTGRGWITPTWTIAASAPVLTASAHQ
jgi:hypothetical protein